MKSFLDFLNEATIKGNIGVPGEGPEGRNEPSYLSGVEEEGRRKAAGNPMQIGGRMMQLMDSNKTLARGKEKELEEFAENIIRSVYSGFMSSVELDIKLVRDGIEVKDFMDEEDEKKKERNKKEQEEQEDQEEVQDEREDQDEQEDQEEQETLRISNDAQLKLEIDKRKLANAITQGEAKNTKEIIRMPECLDGLKEIFGDRNGEQLHRQLLEITDLADKMDWIIPVNVKAEMMERAPQGMAGACSVDWQENKDENKEESQDFAQNVLNELQNKEEVEDLNSMEEEINKIMSSGSPIIRARGIDFVMLIHETVKGIYELIASRGIPEDTTLASNVFLNTETFGDEAEDFRYGPKIAGDLRDFINANRKTDSFPNVREFVFGKMIEMDAESFLSLMKGILMKTPEARTQIDRLIDEIIDELEGFEKDSSDYEMSKRFEQPEEEKPEFGDEEESDIDRLVRQSLSNEEPKPVQKKSYDEMTIAEIQKEINDAVEEENYELAGELTRKYLKGESKKVWETELKRINESHNLRGRI
jgi:hypothetical protein